MEVDSQKIRTAIAEKGLNLKTLATQSDLNVNTIARLATKDCSVHVVSLARLASVLNVKPSSLLKECVWTSRS